MKRPIVIGLLIVALGLVCLGIGAVAFFTANNGFAGNNPFDKRNISSQMEESKTLKVDAAKPLTLKITNAAGDVSITGAEVDTVQVKVVKTAYDSSQARADQEVKIIQYDIKQTGNNITFTYELPKSVNISNNVNTVDFAITVPRQTSVDMSGNMGEVSITGLQGQVAVDNSFGDVTLEQIDGALEVKTSGGSVDVASVAAGAGNIDLYSGFGTITGNQLSGANVTAESDSGKLDVKNVRATQEMQLTSDFGNVSFDKGTAGKLTVSTKSGSIDITSVSVSDALAAINGFGDIHLEQVEAGSYDIQTDSGSILVDGAQGAVKAVTGFGNITIHNAENATIQLNTKSGAVDFEGSLGEGPHTVHSDFGNIELSLPADSALNVDLQTQFGNIRSDIPVTVTLTGETEQSHQTGTINGGGSGLSASTQSGGITITAWDD